MSLFPNLSTVPYINPINVSSNQNILIGKFEDMGREQRKIKIQFPTRNIQLVYRNISLAEASTLLNFERNRNISYELFTFIYPVNFTASYENEYVGQGDGSTVIFNCPFLSGTSVGIKVNNTTQTVGSSGDGGIDCYILEAGGADGVDSLVFESTSIPAAGSIIEADFTGRLAINGRFAEPIKISYNSFGTSTSKAYCNAIVNITGRLMDET